MEDKELDECINYRLAKSREIITHFNYPEINCSGCKDIYDSFCSNYKAKWEFLRGPYNMREMLGN